jgi:tetratricopeptide (TPR) repeat protein
MLKGILHKLFLKHDRSGFATQHSSEESLQDNQSTLTQLRPLTEQGDFAGLEVAGRELLLKKPLQCEAIELVVYSLQQGGRLEAAANIAVQAIQYFPASWTLQFIAGVALKGEGRYKEACQYLRQAIAISPNDRQTLRQLIEAIAMSDGIAPAASEYAAHCQQIGRPMDVVVAPISTVRDWAQKTGLSLLEAGEVEVIPFKVPQVWGSPPDAETAYVLSDKPYVAEINDARIFGNSSLILTSDGTALSDAGGHPKFGRIVSFAYEKVVLAQQPGKVLLDFSEFNTREIEVGMLLSGLASSAFGHWLPEFLPKLQFLQQHPDFAHLPIIVDAGMPQSHLDHLRRLANNPLILIQGNESLLCSRLLVAPAPAFFPVETFPNDIPINELPGLSPRAMRFLRAGESYETKRPRHRRIFLARKNMKWRRLLNEEEIAADLLHLGFETIFIEEMSVSEQIDLFQQAQYIVAPNGSALLNLIFADSSTKLLILTQPNLHNWGTFQGPMDALGYQLLWVTGDNALAEDRKHSDYHVPLPRVWEALSYFGIEDARGRA